jgi:hypothetical protein
MNWVRNLKVKATPAGAPHPLYGEIQSFDRERVKVRLNSGNLQEFAASDVAATEDTFQCDYCHQSKPAHRQRKVFGVSVPRSCDECLSTAKRFLMNTVVRRTK